MSSSVDRIAAVGAAVLAVAAIASVVFGGPRDPPVPPEPDPHPPFVRLPRPSPARAVPPGPVVWDPDARTFPFDGIEVVDVAEGSGARLEQGHVAVLEVTTWLPDGALFESTYESPGPVRWPVGFGDLIPGLDWGLLGIDVGGERTILVAPDQGYGGAGVRGRIPPGVWLQFDVSLLAVVVPPEHLPDPAREDRTGTGAPWAPDRRARIDYAIWSPADPDLPLDSSFLRWYPHVVEPGAPLAEPLRAALTGLRVGGRRVHSTPVDDAFGPAGRPPLAPPGSEVVVRVDLLELE